MTTPRLKRPVSEGAVRSFPYGPSKTKVKRRLLPWSETPHLPTPGGAQCGGGGKTEPTSRAPGVPIEAAPTVPTLSEAVRATSRARSKTDLPARAILPPFDSHGLLTETAVATRLSLSPATLRNWRVKGLGPPFVRLSRRAVRYEAAAVDEWIAARARRSTSERGGENG